MDVRNKFCSNLDYRGSKSRSASRERFTDSTARKIDNDLRSTAVAESISNQRSSHNMVELEMLLRNCRVKKSSLKEKVDIAEYRLRDIIRSQYTQRLIESNYEGYRTESSYLNYHIFYKKLNKNTPLKIPSDDDKLKQLKENRVVHNHNLNNLKHKIEKLRVSESHLLKESDYLHMHDLKSDSRLHTNYNSLSHENASLRYKIQSASRILNS